MQYQKKFQGLKIKVVPIKNNFFGSTITVSGLVTACDLIDQLKYYNKKDGIIIPGSMLKYDENVFLDGYTLNDIAKVLDTKIIASEVSGDSFVNIFLEKTR